MRSDIPAHIGIIMDGNGRWATRRLLPRTAGHRAGVKNIVPVVTAAFDRGVSVVTLYAFSTENKGRAKDEVDGLIDLIRKQMRPMTRDLIARGSRVGFIGDIEYFPNDVQNILCEIAAENSHIENAQIVNIALNYGGREEIARAARLASESGEVTRARIERYLYTADMPPLDMIIRTGGEKRLSNFLLYQAAYAELFFSDTLWPDFNENELTGILDEFAHRQRRFGK